MKWQKPIICFIMNLNQTMFWN